MVLVLLKARLTAGGDTSSEFKALRDRIKNANEDVYELVVEGNREENVILYNSKKIDQETLEAKFNQKANIRVESDYHLDEVEMVSLGGDHQANFQAVSPQPTDAQNPPAKNDDAPMTENDEELLEQLLDGESVRVKKRKRSFQFIPYNLLLKALSGKSKAKDLLTSYLDDRDFMRIPIYQFLIMALTTVAHLQPANSPDNIAHVRQVVEGLIPLDADGKKIHDFSGYEELASCGKDH